MVKEEFYFHPGYFDSIIKALSLIQMKWKMLIILSQLNFTYCLQSISQDFKQRKSFDIECLVLLATHVCNKVVCGDSWGYTGIRMGQRGSAGVNGGPQGSTYKISTFYQIRLHIITAYLNFITLFYTLLQLLTTLYYICLHFITAIYT